MGVFTQLLGSLGGTLAAYGVYRLLKLVFMELTSPLRNLPGPKNPSIIWGNLKEMREEMTIEDALLNRWVEAHGTTFKYHGILGMSRLHTLDPTALNHILMKTDIYQKADATRYILSSIVGAGVLVVEGDKHKQQRKVMNPAFSPSQIRELTQIFVAKSIQLRDVLVADNASQGGISRVEVMSWLSKATLDIIGLAGFNYEFDSLNPSGEENELSAAFASLFASSTKPSIIPMLRAWFPFFRFLRDEKDGEAKQSSQTMARIGNQLLRESKASIHDKSEWKSRDLLSLLVKSNMATDLPENKRMSDQDVLDRESTGTSWALYALSVNKGVQDKLRQELLSVDTENPTMDELNALPYLDMVVREILRLHSPVASTLREAMQDDIIPLSNPWTDSKGVVHDTIRVRKGQAVRIPILGINHSSAFWGTDAQTFRYVSVL
ncbi:hypothetical protein DXG03_003005 [Asterophora parasitica]|uniref:Cytochrome P450 n=1 Tax=Asterophora parasitica TaxID=117018 RepID=A0A9P7KAX2_9AGAR|nr:hypothetical protein DXG03_003005 [Asterophora parasitica]